ncbi:MAG: hypothetical protein M3Y87_09045 [Myxococcota bacterium]|nr:hypothetical protein [Myxococcota bacterium]
MGLWVALLQGIGWRVGREVAEDAIASVKKGDPPAEQDPALVAARLEAQAKAAAKELEAQRKAAAKRAKQQAREVESELAALKKQVAREKK